MANLVTLTALHCTAIVDRTILLTLLLLHMSCFSIKLVVQAKPFVHEYLASSIMCASTYCYHVYYNYYGGHKVCCLAS